MFWHTIIFYIPFLDLFWMSLYSAFESPFEIFLAFSRGFSLVNGIDRFRNHPTNANEAQDSLIGQLIVGVMSSCGSGVMYRWSLAAQTHVPLSRKKPIQQLFPYPGYDFNVSLFTSAIIIGLYQPFTYTLFNTIKGVPLGREFREWIGIPMEVPLSKGDLSIISVFIMILSLSQKHKFKKTS